MKTDPAIAVTRRAREEISKAHGHDPDRLVRYYIELQRRFERRLTGTAPTRVQPNEKHRITEDAPRRSM